MPCMAGHAFLLTALSLPLVVWRSPLQRTYTIKEFEKVTGISAHTLRYFDKVGLLSPIRGENGYRIYSLEQVSIAEVITLLQKAMFSNAEIKELLENYNSQHTIDSLKTNQKKLRSKIVDLRKAHKFLIEHIDYLEHLTVIRQQLNKPFVQWQDERAVGLIQPDNVRDIVDLFDAGDNIIHDPTWPHFCTHGILVATDQICETGYPLQTMYVMQRKVIKTSPFTFPAGNYLTMYCAHSMEDNRYAYALLNYAKQTGFDYLPYLLIEQVSGPVIEKQKEDFLVKMMLPHKNGY